METNRNINYGDNPSILSGKNKKFVPVIIAVFGALLFGLTFYGFGLFDNKEVATPKEATLIKVEKSKAKELEKKKINFTQHGKIALASESSTENYKAIAGEEPAEKWHSNEYLRNNDFSEISQNDWKDRPITHKARVNRKAQAQIELANRQNKRLMRDDTYLYRQTKAEEEEARREQADRLANERQQNLILDQLEKANEIQSTASIPENAKPETEENNLKKKSKLRTKETQLTGRSDISSRGLIAPVVSNNTTAQFWNKQTGFYNLNGKVSQQSYSENRGILAVVHGEADGLSISSGQELKIRLLEPLRLIEQGEKIILPIGALIPCVAKIGSDRLFLNIEGIFWENRLRTVNISVYDIDGREGLNVPALLNNQNANRLINNLSNPISGGQYFMPTGSVSQQVGSSIAMNLAQNAIQTGTQYLRKRTKIQKVEIRSNYKIILFNAKSNQHEMPETNEMEIDNN
jgi:conjugative transposon TraM protein